jgi:hypothetical protein
VYFTASGVLAKTPNSVGQVAEGGQRSDSISQRDTQYPNGRTVFVLPGADLAAVNVPGSRKPRSRLSIRLQNGRFYRLLQRCATHADDHSLRMQAFEYDSCAVASRRVSIGRTGFNNR